MKRAVFTHLLVVGLVLTLGGVGCKKTPKGVTPIPTKGTQAAPGGGVRKGPVDAPPVTGAPPVKTDPGASGQPITDTGGNTKPTPDPLNPIEQGSLDTIEGMVPDASHFASQTIYFEFDSAVVRSAQQGRCNAVGDELKAKPETKLMIDGHCDERGTEEYNRSLGERRALAVREYLIKYGLAPERVFTRSFGEDRPADPGHAEDAWSKNRRAEFILLTPPK